jgi:lathosterol oxidase
MASLIDWLHDAPLGEAIAVLLLENVLVLLVALGIGEFLAGRYAGRRVALPAGPLDRLQVWLTVSTVVLNTAVTLAGLFLWRAGIVTFRTDVGLLAWLDIVVLLLIMDFAMYVLHRLAHHPLLYPLLHRMHHQYDRPRPLTLFILNPFETLSFGILWLAVIAIYPASWFGMSVYLVLNVLFGTIGHLGVEPLPESWARAPVVRWIAGSTSMPVTTRT